MEEETYLPFFFDVVAYGSVESEELRRHIDGKGKVLFCRGVSEGLMENGELRVENGGGAWREVRLGDFFKVKHGFAFKGEGISNEKTSQILVTPGNFHIGGGFKSNKFKYYVGEFPVDYLLKEDNVVITMTDLSKETDTLGYSAKIPYSEGTKYLHNQRVGLVQFKNNEADSDFLYWLMRTREYQGYIVGSASGTSIMHTSPTRIENYQFQIPPLPEQKAIAEVLSALDDKIDLLHRQNKTLEQMAETLFRQWFVVEAGEDWEEGVLPNEFYFLMGQSPKGSSFNEIKIGMPMFQGNADFGFRFPSERIYTTEPKRLAQPFDTLISVRAPVGAQNMAKKECCIGRGVVAFRYKVNHDFYTYTYFKLESLTGEIKKFNDEGTVFGSISKGDFQKMEITIPPDNLVGKYETEVKPINDKVIKNCGQIRTLQSLRDTLLPKLMSGEVRVQYDKEVKQ
ncbi:Type I restriction-modification system, specificity subunit S (EC [uncultured Gammaproteobacteria bacterium]|nr:Type I restriction-modification system, specificity subunit S (EC [uncultured Gammaproteobacteria bacterium]